MEQQLELLDKILTLYKSRYYGKELEDKFNEAAKDLIETNDIKRINYVKFCKMNDILPVPTSSGESYSDPCGHGSSSRGQNFRGC